MKKQLPAGMKVLRGQTQTNVNEVILTYLYNRFDKDTTIRVLDLPCGNLEFLVYVQELFPSADLHGADIVKPAAYQRMNFWQMDLTKDFILPPEMKFDLVSSISGVMMFSNTLSFVRNCSERLKQGGTFILTNDNNATIKDRLAYLFIGRYRIFNLVFEDDQPMTENVPIHELVRLIRIHGIDIEDISYTSLYLKDLIYLPLALIVYLSQWLYLNKLRTKLPGGLKWKMYPFKHLLYRHYIIRGVKKSEGLKSN